VWEDPNEAVAGVAPGGRQDPAAQHALRATSVEGRAGPRRD